MSRRWRSLLDERTLWQDFAKQEHNLSSLHPLSANGRLWRDQYTRALSVHPSSLSSVARSSKTSCITTAAAATVASAADVSEVDEAQRRRM